MSGRIHLLSGSDVLPGLHQIAAGTAGLPDGDGGPVKEGVFKFDHGVCPGRNR